ncbi:hypothetical protein [Nocardia alni]|uniref:hypothetical protein n=1 Tax=Nocardia alni TaxID=2815723 RepID=UPI001C2492B6|nr:hypothetical protein [Nocardia alni]
MRSAVIHTPGRRSRPWLLAIAAVPVSAAIVCGSLAPATAATGGQAGVTAGQSGGGQAGVTSPAPAPPAPAAPVMNGDDGDAGVEGPTQAQPYETRADPDPDTPAPVVAPSQLHAPRRVAPVLPIRPAPDTVRVGSLAAPRPHWLPHPIADRINSDAAVTEAHIADGWNAVGVPRRRSDRVAAGTVAGAVAGAAIGGVAAAVPGAVAGGAAGAVVGAGVGAVAGAAVGVGGALITGGAAGVGAALATGGVAAIPAVAAIPIVAGGTVGTAIGAGAIIGGVAGAGLGALAGGAVTGAAGAAVGGLVGAAIGGAVGAGS